MNDEIKQLQKLLSIANDDELSDSYIFYNSLFRNLNVNIVIVNSNMFDGINKHICDMDEQEYLEYDDKLKKFENFRFTYFWIFCKIEVINKIIMTLLISKNVVILCAHMGQK